MSWKIRHQGSPKSIDLDNAQVVLEGLRDGHWQATDEVIGPTDTDWQALEVHPVFAEAVAEFETPLQHEPPDESRLDMNPLIDVALVLLVFFILTTSYDALRKVLDMPRSPDDDSKPKPVQLKDIQSKMIMCKAREEGGKPTLRVDGELVSEDDLANRMRDLVRRSNKTDLFIDAKDVPWEMFVGILNAAKGAGVQKIVLPNRTAQAAPAAAPAKKP